MSGLNAQKGSRATELTEMRDKTQGDAPQDTQTFSQYHTPPAEFGQ